MKRIILSAMLLTASAFAHEEAEAAHEEHVAAIHSETGFYGAVKALVTLGNDVDEGEGVTLEGDSGKGAGIELGYKIGYGFAVEADATFARNRVTEVRCIEEECEREEGDGEYTTVSLDLVYNYHITHHAALFVKGGYEYETESIDSLDVNGNDTGFIYAVGTEYAVGEHTAFLLEYEGTTIDGPRGNSIFAGLVYAF
jgi:outer membrane protein X